MKLRVRGIWSAKRAAIHRQIRMLSHSAFALLWSAILALGPSPAFAHGEIDQSFTCITGRGVWFDQTVHRGQSFTPTRSTLYGVDLLLGSWNDPWHADVTVRIREGAGFAGASLAEVTLDVDGTTWSEAWVHFDLPSPISVTPGNLYTIEVAVTNSSFGLPFAQTEDCVYVGGTGFYSMFPFDVVTPVEGVDYNFRTYADSVCGDSQIGSDEQCDDGNLTDGDCCSSTCEYEPADSACASDGNLCTGDVCDGAGSCTHPNNSVPCDDGDPCTVGDLCAVGVCTSGPLTPGACIDHYMCYKVKITKDTPKLARDIEVNVVDQLETRKYKVTKPTKLCLAADKEGEGMVHPAARLMCYKVVRAKGEPKHIPIVGVFHATDQFGTLQVDTITEREICIPTVVEDR